MNTDKHRCLHLFTAWVFQVYPMGFVRSCVFCDAKEFLKASEQHTILNAFNEENPCPSVLIGG
jgi:hypothetical protein